MEEKRKNDLGLSEDDLTNLKQIMNDLIDIVVKFNGSEEPTENEYAELLGVLDYAKFIASGIAYSNALDLCGVDHDEDEDGVE